MQLRCSEVRNRHGVWGGWKKEIPWLAGVRDGRVYLRAQGTLVMFPMSHVSARHECANWKCKEERMILARKTGHVNLGEP